MPANTPPKTDTAIASTDSRFPGNQPLGKALVDAAMDLGLIVNAFAVYLYHRLDCSSVQSCKACDMINGAEVGQYRKHGCLMCL